MNAMNKKEVPKYPELDQDEVVDNLKKEFMSLEQGYQKALEKRKSSYQQYAMQAYGIEQKGRSRIVDSTIFDKVEWMMANVLRPIVEGNEIARITPESPSAVVTAEAQQELITLQLKRKQNWHMINHDAIKSMFIGGQGYAKTKWVKQGKDNYVGYLKVTPLPDWQIRYDWDVSDFYESSVHIHDNDLTESELRRLAKDSDFFNIIDGENLLENTTGSPTRGAEWFISDNEKRLHKKNLGNDHEQGQDAGKWFRVHEQWTVYDVKGDGIFEEVLAVWCNDILIRFHKMKTPDGQHPFLIGQGIREPYEAHGWSLADVLGPIQKMKTMVDRDIIDNLASQNNGMYEVVDSDVSVVSRQILRAGVAGSIVPVTRPGSINPLRPAPISQQAFAFRELLGVDADNRSGFTKSSSLDTKMLRSTATGASIVQNTGQMRIWEIAARYVSTFFVPLVRRCIAYNKAYLSDVSVKRVFGENAGSWLSITSDDLQEEVSLNVELSLAGDRQEKLQNMFTYAQYFGPMAEQIPELQKIFKYMAVKAAKLMDLNEIEAQLIEGEDNESPIVYTGPTEDGGASPADEDALPIEEEPGIQGTGLEELIGGGEGAIPPEALE